MEKTKKSHYQYSSDQTSIPELILFSIYSVASRGESCDFERLIKECFTNFPKGFGFLKYPQWPDARKLDRALRDLRVKKLIKGDPKTVFSLTKNGEKTAEEIAKIIKQERLFK